MKMIKFEMLYPPKGLQWEHSLEGCSYIVVDGYTFPYRGDIDSVINVYRVNGGVSYLILSRNINREVARLDVYNFSDNSQVKFTVIVNNSDTCYWNAELVGNLPYRWDSDPHTIAETLYNAHPLLRV